MVVDGSSESLENNRLQLIRIIDFEHCSAMQNILLSEGACVDVLFVGPVGSRE